MKVNQPDVDTLQREIVQKNQEIAELKASASWRITAPLRWLSGSVKRLFARHSPEEHQPLTIASSDYERWIQAFDESDAKADANLRTQLDELARMPLVSLLLALQHSDELQLADVIATLQSIQQQIYPNWEVCIACDSRIKTEIRTWLNECLKSEGRLKVSYTDVTSTSSAQAELCNHGLALVSMDSANPSEWVLRLNASDLIANKALFSLIKVAIVDANIKLIYADEDAIDQQSVRQNPYFKSDWNLDLHLSHHLIGRFGFYSTALMRQLGGYRTDSGAALDFDLSLRCIERLNDGQIRHTPRILFHAGKRQNKNKNKNENESEALSTAFACDEGVQALAQHFARENIDTSVQNIGHGYHISYALPAALPLVSLIIPTRNGVHLLRQCIDSIRQKTSYQHFEIIVVDNGSDEPASLAYLSAIAKVDNIRVIRIDAPFNYSALNNAAVNIANGEIIGLVNNDIEVISPDWLGEMVSHALRPGVGAVGARLWFPDETLQHGGVILGMGGLGVAAHAHMRIAREALGEHGRASLTQNFSAVTAACLVIKKSTYAQVGGLDEENLPIAFNDVDFCLRVRDAGYRNVWTPFAELYHHESASRGDDLSVDKRLRAGKEISYMMQQWQLSLQSDPAYSPNLSLDKDDFSYAWPPRVASLQRPIVQQTGVSPLYKRLKDLRKSANGVAYFAENMQSSTYIYRAANMVEVLNHAVQKDAIETSAACFYSHDIAGDTVHAKIIADDAHCLVISRARYEASLLALVQQFKQKNKKVIFDIDDWVFNVKAIDLIVKTNGEQATDDVLNYWYSVVGRMAQTLRLCDGAITTNAFLAEKIKQFVKRTDFSVQIVSNFTNQAQWSAAQPLYERKLAKGFKQGERIKLGYFSGSASHNVDVALISTALECLMAADPRIDLVVVGHVDIGKAFGKRFSGYLTGHLASRFVHHPFTDVAHLQQLIADVDFNLVPLQQNEFTHCKSELKYFDAAAVGTLTIASPAQAYATAIQHGVNGYLADDANWYNTLTSAIEQREQYASMVIKAYQDVQQRFVWNQQRSVLIKALALE